MSLLGDREGMDGSLLLPIPGRGWTVVMWGWGNTVIQP